MNNKTKMVASVLFALLAASPFIATVIGMVVDGSLFDSYKNQFALLQVIVMFVYCIPAIVISFICLLFGNSKLGQDKLSTARTFFIGSIITSIIGILLMYAWVATRDKDEIDKYEHMSITLDEASKIINNCEIKQVMIYRGLDGETVKFNPATTTDGLVLEKFDGRLPRIWVAKDAEGKLRPIVTEAEKTCGHIEML